VVDHRQHGPDGSPVSPALCLSNVHERLLELARSVIRRAEIEQGPEVGRPRVCLDGLLLKLEQRPKISRPASMKGSGPHKVVWILVTQDLYIHCIDERRIAVDIAREQPNHGDSDALPGFGHRPPMEPLGEFLAGSLPVSLLDVWEGPLDRRFES